MRTGLFVIVLSVFFQQFNYNQPVYPDLPEEDYIIYTTIINDLSKCDDDHYAHGRNRLLFIEPITKKADKHLFRLDYIKTEENLSYSLHTPRAAFYKEPAWQAFIASTDTSQFAQYEIKKLLTPICRKTAVWSPEIQNYYSGKETVSNRGYYALRKDYPYFGSITSFSKVVYSPDQTKALCYHSQVSDGRAGSGAVSFLERNEGNWKVVGKVTLWVS